MKTILLFLLLVQTVYTSQIPDLREEAIPLNKNVSMEMVNVRNGLWVAKYELTQGQWFAVMGKGEMYRTAPWLQDPTIRDDNKPMDNCSLALATNFCAKMSVVTHSKIRLPTEEEWDFFSNGTEFGDAVCSVGLKQSQQQPCVVGTKKPNRFGLYDVRGNMLEICSGSWLAYRTGKMRTDRPSIVGGTTDMTTKDLIPLRGGCYWMNSKKMMELNCREIAITSDVKSAHGVGFRVVMEK